MQAFISEIDRRAFLRLAGAGLGAAAFGATSTTLPGEELIGLKAVTPKEPVLRIEARMRCGVELGHRRGK